MPLHGQWAAETIHKCRTSVTWMPPVKMMTADGAKDYSCSWLSIWVFINTVLTEVTAVASPLWQTPLLSLHTLIQYHPPQPSLKYTFYFSEGLFKTDPAPKQHVRWQPQKKTTLKVLPVILLSPMRLNYSFSCARNANVIADFLNKHHHHYNNYWDS